MDIEKLFQELEELLEEIKGEERQKEIEGGIVGYPTAYASNGVLSGFDDYIVFEESYSENMPIWAEVFHQIILWQFQQDYDGTVSYYYDNFYENTDYRTIMKVAKYLEENGYYELHKYYVAPAVEYDEKEAKDFEYPEEMYPVLKKTEQWIEVEEGRKTVWDFYVDILTKNKAALIAVQKEKQK